MALRPGDPASMAPRASAATLSNCPRARCTAARGRPRAGLPSTVVAPIFDHPSQRAALPTRPPVRAPLLARLAAALANRHALGAMTYEMLAGEPPFTGPTAQAIVARVMTERARPLRSVRVRCCGQMFAISPDGRWLLFQGRPVADSALGRAETRVALHLRDLTDLRTRRLPGTVFATSTAPRRCTSPRQLAGLHGERERP